MLRGLRKRLRRRRMHLSEPFHTVYPFTLASFPRQQNLLRLAELVERDQIPGAIVECGVLDGGMSGLMASATAPSGRAVHMFDSWDGLPETTAEDKESGKKWSGEMVGSPRRVAQCMALLGVDQHRLHFHKGWFNETFPHIDIGQIALLHIDCDFYDPTKLCLDTWYPKIAPGGFVQFDDYDAFVGCRTAVDRFLSANLGVTLESFGTGGAAYFLRKPVGPTL